MRAAAGVNAWETAGPGKARAPIEIEPPVTRRQAAARASAKAKAAAEEGGVEECSGDDASQGASPPDAGPLDAGSDDAGEGMALRGGARVGRTEGACRAGSCGGECHEPHVFALQVGLAVRAQVLCCRGALLGRTMPECIWCGASSTVLPVPRVMRVVECHTWLPIDSVHLFECMAGQS